MMSTGEIINFTLANVSVKTKLRVTSIPQKSPIRFTVKHNFHAVLFPLLKTSHTKGFQFNSKPSGP
ncbi:hypothetical protein SAMN04488023_12330 [Pedobacter rhizosphaerae]|uniref:Uncharacterized protein n=1 Tax=Pedobacter rhizosphaerae TaxID=390241 RepID=A0A1H9TJJ5_9SPHI|nr:hypothetical protein SAMN04488023_12330 [Pedobacter rhizosphaerae]